MVRRTVLYRGEVQGVGFRWTAVRVAAGFAVAGYVRNREDGRVELVAEGEAEEVAAFCMAVAARMEEGIHGVEERDSVATGEFGGFTISY